ncbi:MAG: SDR family NAD(P)-dependent oxidoreductase [Bacillota bacterium]
MNKVVLVSGASSGIGFATAKYLSEKNYNVIGVSRSYPKTKYNFDYLLCDISDEANITKTINIIAEKYGRVDFLINSAGLGISGAIENTKLEDVKTIYNVNVYGHFLLTKATLKLLRNSPAGKIINISSIASEIALPFQSFYSMTKASIDAFTKALRIEVKPFNIQVMSLLPGDIKTDFTKNRKKTLDVKDDLYKARVDKSINKMELDETQGMEPLVIAKAIYKYLKKKKLPITKTIGFSYKMIRFLNRIFPEKLVYYFVNKLYG